MRDFSWEMKGLKRRLALEKGNHIRIATCYFAAQVSKIYKSRGLDHKDPFAALKTDIAIYSQLGIRGIFEV